MAGTSSAKTRFALLPGHHSEYQQNPYFYGLASTASVVSAACFTDSSVDIRTSIIPGSQFA
jgi:hypothetical protein